MNQLRNIMQNNKTKSIAAIAQPTTRLHTPVIAIKAITNPAREILSQFDGKLKRLVEYCLRNYKDEVYLEFSNILIKYYLSDKPASKKPPYSIYR